MTTHAAIGHHPTASVPDRARTTRRPSPGVALASAVAAGAALGALHGVSDAAPTGVGAGVTTLAADLHLGHSPDASPVPASTAHAAGAHDAASAVPELTKSAHLDRQATEADAAISRFMSHIGSTQYENWCERAVENAYGTQGHFASAIEDWQASDQHHDWQHAPRGALVFYKTSSDGHVALSLGDGRVVSSSAHHQVGVVPVGFFQHPLGWAPSPY